MGLNYFLNKKIVEILTDKFPAKDFFGTYVPTSVKQKIKFEPIRAVEADMFLSNYMHAYSFSKPEKVLSDIAIKNILALLYLEKEDSDLKFETLFKTVKSLEKGNKPKTKIEKLLLNFIEINRLINKPDFKIDEDNYELIIHLLFRNSDFNLDRRVTYYRSEKNSAGLTVNIEPENIEKEMITLFRFIKESAKDSFDGFTKAIITFVQVLITQPYKKYNASLALIMSNWFISQHDKEIFKCMDLFEVANKWELIIKTVNTSFSKDKSYDNLLHTIRSIIQQAYKKSFLLKLLEEWIADDQKRNSFFPSINEKIVLQTIIQERSDQISLEQIIEDLSINASNVIDTSDIELAIANLKAAQVVDFTEGGKSLIVLIPELDKLKKILK